MQYLNRRDKVNHPSMPFFDLNNTYIIEILLEKRTIIFLAICGAVIATLGNLLVRWQARGGTFNVKVARLIVRIGYGLTWSSILIFIIAGFVGVTPTIQR